MAADIIELFEAFKENAVMYNWDLTIVILSLWTASLLQFTFVVGSSKTAQSSPVYDRKTGDSAIVSSRNETRGQRQAWSENSSDRERSASSNRRRSCCSGSGCCCCCCTADAVSILTSITLQDGPFLVLRMLLIFRYNVLSYTNIFFTSKNTLVILLQVYRLTVLYCERQNKKRNRRKRRNEENNKRKEDTVATVNMKAANSSCADSGQGNAMTGCRQSERKDCQESENSSCFCCIDKYHVDELNRVQEKEEEEKEEEKDKVIVINEDLFEEMSESDMLEILTCSSLHDSQMWECVSSSPSMELCSPNQVKCQQPDKKRRRIGRRSEEDAYSDSERRQRYRDDCPNCKEAEGTQQTFKSNTEFRNGAQSLPMALQKKKGKMKKGNEDKIKESEFFLKTQKETLQTNQEIEPNRQQNKNSDYSAKSLSKDPKSKRPKLFQVAIEAGMQTQQCGINLADDKRLKPDLTDIMAVRMMRRCPNCANLNNGRQYGQKRRLTPEGFIICKVKEPTDNAFA